MSNSPAAYIEDGRLVIRASSLDRCQRCLVGLALGFTPMSVPEKAVAVFHRGHRVEEEVIPALVRKGWAIGSRQERVELAIGDTGIVRGHIDAKGHPNGTLPALPEPYLVEVKSCAPTSWDAWTTGRWEAWNKWEWQTSIYGHATGLPVMVVAAQIVDGEWTGELDFHTISTPRIPLSRIHARVEEVRSYVEEGRLPVTCSSHDWPCPLYHLCSQPEVPPDIDPALDTLSSHLDTIRGERKQLEGVEKEIRSRIDELLGDREKVRTDAWSVTRVESARSSLDKTKLQEAFGDLSAYEKTTISSSIRVSRRKDGRGGVEAGTGSVGQADPGVDIAPRGGGEREDDGGDVDRRPEPADGGDENLLLFGDGPQPSDRTVPGDDPLPLEER